MKKELYLNCVPDISSSHPSSLKINLGLVNRLLIWQYFHHISQIFDCSLVVNKSFWPEETILNFPDTKFVDDSYIKNKECYSLDPKTLTKKLNHVLENYITSEDIENPTLSEDIFQIGTGAGGLTPSDDFHSEIFYSKILVYVNNILQKPEESYTFKGNRIFFVKPIEKGSKCNIFYYKESYKKIKNLELPYLIESLDRIDLEKFLVFDDISHLFDGLKTKFQLSITKLGFTQIAHYLLRPCVNKNNSIFNIDGKEYNCLIFDCDYSSIIDKLYNKLYDKLIDFVNIHSDCHKTAGFFYNLRMVKFKNNQINQFFQNNFSDVIGVQIRRGPNTFINKKYIDDLKKYVDLVVIKKYYKHMYTINGSRGYLSIKEDSYYYEMIDSIIKENPNKKIYLSYDVPKSFINHFLEKYPNNLIAKQNYLDEYLNYFNEYDCEKNDLSKISIQCYKFDFKKSIVDLLDFFALCHSETIIGKKLVEESKSNSYSSWLFVTKCYNGKKII